MSDYRSEASSRSAVKTELTSAHLECLLISPASGLFVAAVWMQTTGACQYVVERRSLVRVLVAAHDCRRPQVLLHLAAVRDGPSPNGVVCPVWLTAIAITTNNVTMPAMTTTRTIHAPTPNSDGYGGGWAIASSYRRLHT